MKRKQKEGVRLTLDLSRKAYGRLEELETEAEAESKSSLLRQALQVYEALFYRARDGFRVVAIKGPVDWTTPPGTEKVEIVIPGVTDPRSALENRPEVAKE